MPAPGANWHPGGALPDWWLPRTESGASRPKAATEPLKVVAIKPTLPGSHGLATIERTGAIVPPLLVGMLLNRPDEKKFAFLSFGGRHTYTSHHEIPHVARLACV